MTSRWVFLTAYTCSGLASIVYEVVWSRLFALSMGHTTAAASAVIAAFMAGLAIGAALAGRLVDRLTRRQALLAYALLEGIVAASALAMPLVLPRLIPALQWSYQDGNAAAFFPVVRLLLCGLLLVPTIALGATFPVAARANTPAVEPPPAGTRHRRPQPAGRRGLGAGALYAANTVGAAIGAVASGFVLIPALGLSATTFVGVAATLISAMLVLAQARRTPDDEPAIPAVIIGVSAIPVPAADRIGLAASIVMLTGVATFMYEISWMRLFAMLTGPSTYAFAATTAAFIGGLALGSVAGAFIASRTRQGAAALSMALTGAAVFAGLASVYAGGPLPGRVLRELTALPGGLESVLIWQAMAIAALIVPTAIGLGAAFPLALDLARGQAGSGCRRIGIVYAANTVAAVAGALGAGFIAIPMIGLQHTIRFASMALLAAAALTAARAASGRVYRIAALTMATLGAGFVWSSAPWDHELMASGPYMRAVVGTASDGVETEAVLKAGTLLYYREGAAGTVSVRRLNGAVSMAIDGKIDASTSSDMLTQKALAHLPLLLHEAPERVAIVGLGSGITLASALTHPVAAADVIEISPEVVAASRYFAAQNRNALDDPRTRLVVADGRSHLLLSRQTYDVIVSEPSNPWMAGVASLFTREFFLAARARLAPGGLLCQWAHTYNISDADLRSIVATFASVFPDATLWLVGDGDLLMVGSDRPIDARLANVARAWSRPGVAADLDAVSARDPFALLSMFVAGPAQTAAYANGAPLQTDDRMRLEFSGPAALFADARVDNSAALKQLRETGLPTTVAAARAGASAASWRNRGRMMLGAGAADVAYEDFVTALQIDPWERDAVTGVTEAAGRTGQQADAMRLLERLGTAHPDHAGVFTALSRLYAGSRRRQDALVAATKASGITPTDPAALEQLASIYSDAGDAGMLAQIAAALQRIFPNRGGGYYYGAAAEFIAGRLEPALALVRHATAIDGTRAAAFNLRGAVHARLGQTAEARAAFTTALELDPRDPATYTNFGLLELESGHRDAASDLFAEALALDPASESGRQGWREAMQASP